MAKQSKLSAALKAKAQLLLFQSFDAFVNDSKIGKSYNKYSHAQFLYNFISENTSIFLAPNFLTFVSNTWDEYLEELANIHNAEDVQGFIKDMNKNYYLSYFGYIQQIQKVIAAFNQ